jgi:hypothetical protein
MVSVATPSHVTGNAAGRARQVVGNFQIFDMRLVGKRQVLLENGSPAIGSRRSMYAAAWLSAPHESIESSGRAVYDYGTYELS